MDVKVSADVQRCPWVREEINRMIETARTRRLRRVWVEAYHFQAMQMVRVVQDGRVLAVGSSQVHWEAAFRACREQLEQGRAVARAAAPAADRPSLF